jgi:hypothetical protein
MVGEAEEDFPMSIETSAELKELFAALAKAQAEMKPAPKNSVNPAFARGQSKGSKYADLADCMESIRPHLSKHGLCLSQMYGGPEIFTLLGHASGQWIRSRIAIPGFENLTPQQIGSATTYLRRYSLGIVGLVTDEDDDGNAASKPVESQPEQYSTGWTAQDTKKATEFAKKVIQYVDEGRDVMEIWDEITPAGEEFVRAVWVGLPKPIKTLIKDENDKRNKAKAA